MPAKSRWLLKIPEIIERLSQMDAPVVDRAVCERLFGIGRRRAIDLMQKFGGYQAGNTILVDGSAFIQHLQRMLDDPEFEQERRRKRRLSEHLTELEKHSRAAAVRIPVGPETVHQSPDDLPDGIFFEPGRLRVDYGNVEELLRRLFELAQAAANDFDEFSKLAMPAAPRAGRGTDGQHPGHP
jgi:hypothetical protein